MWWEHIIRFLHCALTVKRTDRYTDKDPGIAALLVAEHLYKVSEKFLRGKTIGELNDCFLGETRLAKNFQKVLGGGWGRGVQPRFKTSVPQVKI